MIVTNRNAIPFIRNLVPFTNQGKTFYGQKFSSGGGLLNPEEHQVFYIDLDIIEYIVYSYHTPIAWVTKDGTKYRVKQKFSSTTSKHQAIVYHAWS